MKEIFLSFRPEYFKPLLYGIKKYEYRKRFCEEETRAYLYLSGKSRTVVGVMELGKSIRLDFTRENYLNYPETLKRVDAYIAGKDINAIPIKSLTLFKTPISLEEIRKESLVKYCFMPYLLGLKLKNIDQYYKFLNGDGLNDFLEFHTKNKRCQAVVNDIYGASVYIEEKEKSPVEEYIENIYGKYLFVLIMINIMIE